MLYHILVIWLSTGVEPQDVWDELSNRQSQSGIEEKKMRGKKNEEKI